MRIHADSLTFRQIADAAQVAHVDLDTMIDHGSRKRNKAFEIHLTGDSPRRPNSGKYGADGDDFAASWDQWGIFLAELFKADESVTIPRIYGDADQFNEATGGRFETLTYGSPSYHREHKWNSHGHYTASCKCGARKSWEHYYG
jgi:hypothetical protein